MKILFKLRPGDQHLAARLAGDPLLAKALGPKPNGAVGFLFPKFFDAAGPVLPRLLELAAGEHLSFLRDMNFSASELDTADHLEVVCRSTIGQTRADVRETQAAYAADRLHPTASRWQVRLPQQLFLSKPVPAGAISHLDQWTGEYALGSIAAQALQASSLAGWTLQPLLHPKTRADAGSGMHLSTRELLPPALDDGTRRETPDDGLRRQTTPRRYGLLSYGASALDPSPDFARTAEPWGAWQTPQWVVRQSVRQWYAQAGLSGWAFWPVLQQGSELHRQHGEQWRQALSTVRSAGAELLA